MFRRRSARHPLRPVGRIRQGRCVPQELILANQMIEKTYADDAYGIVALCHSQT